MVVGKRRGDAGGTIKGAFHGRDIHRIGQLNHFPSGEFAEAVDPYHERDNPDGPAAARARDIPAL